MQCTPSGQRSLSSCCSRFARTRRGPSAERSPRYQARRVALLVLLFSPLSRRLDGEMPRPDGLSVGVHAAPSSLLLFPRPWTVRLAPDRSLAPLLFLSLARPRLVHHVLLDHHPPPRALPRTPSSSRRIRLGIAAGPPGSCRAAVSTSRPQPTTSLPSSSSSRQHHDREDEVRASAGPRKGSSARAALVNSQIGIVVQCSTSSVHVRARLAGREAQRAGRQGRFDRLSSLATFPSSPFSTLLVSVQAPRRSFSLSCR